MRLFRALLLSSRPISWINTAFPFAAGYYLVGHSIDAVMIVGTLFFLIPYNVAMYGVNDVFDYKSDLANPRKGGIEGALLTPQLHRSTLIAAAVLCLPFIVFLSASADWPGRVALFVSLFFVLAYSVPVLRFKERPVLDSITSSIHFVSPAVLGMVMAGTSFPPVALLIIAAFLLWGIAAHAFGAVQDIQPDREAGIASIATVFGARATVRFSICVWLLAMVLMAGAGWPIALAGLVGVMYVVNAAPYWNVDDETSALTNRAWRRFIYLNYFSGFLVTLCMIFVETR